MMFLFRHATFARRGTLLHAAADFLMDPPFPRVFSFIFQRQSAERFRTLRRFLGPPAGILAVSPLGIFRCFRIDCIVPGSGSVSVASWWASVFRDSHPTWSSTFREWLSFLLGWLPFQPVFFSPGLHLGFHLCQYFQYLLHLHNVAI
jgi:hypothetical protein